MSFILSTVVLLASAVSSVAESNQFPKAIDQATNQTNLYQIARQSAAQLDLQAKNPPCDPIRCY